MINTFRWKNNKFIGIKKILGLAIDEKSVLAIEMCQEGEGFRVKHSARMEFPEGISFSTPDRLGELLGQFIREKGLSAKRVVIGLPAKWIMIHRKDVPPSSGVSVAGMLKIHAEHEFSINPDDLVIDYAGNVFPDKSSRLLLGAVQRKNYENILKAVHKAGLSVLSVTVSSMALRSMVCSEITGGSPDYFICLRPDYAEIVVGDKEQVVDIKYVRRDKSGKTDSLIPELERIISFSRNKEDADEKPRLMIMNLSEDDYSNLPDLQKNISSLANIIDCETRPLLRKLDFPLASESKEFLASAAIIQRYRQKDSFFLDFYNSRMNEKVVRIKKNQVMWASAVILCLIIFVINMIYTWESDKGDIAELKQKLAEMNEDLTSAQGVIQKMDYARRWYSERPEILRCLYELTMAFPVEGKIWATNLAINEEMKGIVSGRATNEKSVIEVLDGLKSSKLFDNVQMIYLRENGQSTQEVSFSMSFSFKGRGL